MSKNKTKKVEVSTVSSQGQVFIEHQDISSQNALKKKAKPIKKSTKKIKTENIKNTSGRRLYTFSNVINNKNLNAKPFHTWAIDFTTINTALEGQPKSKHSCFVIIDHFTRKALASKVFFFRHGKGGISSAQVIKVIKDTLKRYEVKGPLIIHSDNGTSFDSKEYRDFIENDSRLIGSTSRPGVPTDNAVVERWNNTLKNQYHSYDLKPDATKPFPDFVSSTQKLQTIVNKKVNYLNSTARYKYNQGLSSNEFQDLYYQKQKNNTLVPLAFDNAAVSNIEPKSDDERMILAFRTGIRENLSISDTFKDFSTQQKLQLIENTGQLSLNAINDLQASQDFKLSVIEKKINTIADAVVKKKKKKPVPAKKRDIIDFTIFQQIINQSKPRNTHYLTWSRFRIACVLLFFTGLRVGEVAYTTETMINSLIKYGKCEFYQPKVNKSRICFLPANGLQYLEKVKDDIKQVFHSDSKNGEEIILYPYIETSHDKWITLINSFLFDIAKENGLTLKSHSFRIGYITKILEHLSVDRAQSFVGHKDIRSTMVYNRYKVSDEKSLQLLEKCFE